MPCMPTEADLHPRTRERLADWRADPEVRGVLWVGSRSRGYGDQMSDDDLEILLTPEAHARITPGEDFEVEREGRRLLIGGDTALTDAFRAHRRFGPFEAAVMPIGAYNPWITNHCTPEQAVAMADAAGARLFVPVHHQSFSLSREPVREPIERTEQMLRDERDRLALSEVGQTIVIPA